MSNEQDAERLKVALRLLERAEDACEDRPPDANWWRDYFRLLRRSMILTEEGWEDPSVAEWYREDDADWEPDEVLAFDDDPDPERRKQANALIAEAVARGAVVTEDDDRRQS